MIVRVIVGFRVEGLGFSYSRPAERVGNRIKDSSCWGSLYITLSNFWASTIGLKAYSLGF